MKNAGIDKAYNTCDIRNSRVMEDWLSSAILYVTGFLDMGMWDIPRDRAKDFVVFHTREISHIDR